MKLEAHRPQARRPMSTLSRRASHLLRQIDERDVLNVSIPEQGVWTNRVTRIVTSRGVYYTKEFLPLAASRGYDPPRTSRRARTRISWASQRLAYYSLTESTDAVPAPLAKAPTAFIMEGASGSDLLHNHLVVGEIPRALAETTPQILSGFTRISKLPLCSSDIAAAQRFVQYKVRLQYTRHYDGVEQKHLDQIRRAGADYLATPKYFTHGDLNSRNILLTASGRVTLIDFDHWHLGSPVYDLAYLLSEVVIAAALSTTAPPDTEEPRRLFTALLAEPPIRASPLRLLGPHLAAHLLYRLDGPSARRWSGHLNGAEKSTIRDISSRLVFLREPDEIFECLGNLT